MTSTTGNVLIGLALRAATELFLGGKAALVDDSNVLQWVNWRGGGNGIGSSPPIGNAANIPPDAKGWPWLSKH